MYDAIDDPYCYPGTTVLKNRRALRSQSALTRFETAATALRFSEPLPGGRLSVRHYRAIHHHLFQDVYTWAGKLRTIRLSKDGSVFCYPENIHWEMNVLFDRLRRDEFLIGLSAATFAHKAARFLATLNGIHAFRDGNGRAQLVFMAVLADTAGRPLNLRKLEPARFLAAMIRSFHGEEDALSEQLAELVA
jgi:cell filamentation protein, protein adenylyltransferase